ncbi:MAG: hypothetical protein SVM80_10005 [Halobacteriota archaeon]|nr:hypothetical protein [Halobacteriota archaeon]
MTLVQASIANNGETVIIVADRLLTRSFGEKFPSYEFEGNSPKIISRGKVGIGFAGSALYADMVTSELSTDISDFDEIVGAISNFVKNTRGSIFSDVVFKVTGISPEDFYSNPQIVPDPVRDFIYGWRMEFQLDFECIVAGFDKDKNAKITHITEDGSIISATNFGVDSIGSGSLFSQIYFDQYNYEVSMPEIGSLFFAYKAKKWAEAPTGVGLKTDIILFRKYHANTEIQNENGLMSEINKVYEEEKERNRGIRDELLKRLIKIGSGELI